MAVCSMLCTDGLLLHLVGKRQPLVYSGASYGNGKLGDSIWESHHTPPPPRCIEWRPKSAGKWHPFQWEAILHCPTAEGHRAVPSSVSRNGDCLHVWLTGRADLIRLFQKTLPVNGDAVRFLYTLLSTPPCERRYA